MRIAAVECRLYRVPPAAQIQDSWELHALGSGGMTRFAPATASSSTRQRSAATK